MHDREVCDASRFDIYIKIKIYNFYIIFYNWNFPLSKNMYFADYINIQMYRCIILLIKVF